MCSEAAPHHTFSQHLKVELVLAVSSVQILAIPNPPLRVSLPLLNALP